MKLTPTKRPWAMLTAVALAAAALLSFTPPAAADAAPNSPALTPPLGWNSWNTFYCNIDEGKIRGAADAMVSSGMKDAGYEYVVVDDCWQASERAADGSLQADPVRFPSGMKALGDYIHSKGMKFGIYQAPRDRTCAQFFGGTPGSTGARGHEVLDANTFAAWGVDFLKYDWCSAEGSLEDQISAFTLMRDALRATGRPIVYSINPNSIRPNRGAEYYWGDIADMWRTTEDITATWSSGCRDDCFMGVTEILDVQAGLTSWNGPGHWNDPDMLEVGKGNILNPTENRAHFGMWALMASPLIAGNDITTMTSDTRSILTNKRIIAVNQDPNGKQASRIRDNGAVEVWAKQMSDGSVTVGLLNRGESSVSINSTASEIGLPTSANYVVEDLYTGGTTNTTGAIGASVPRHGLALLRVTPGAVDSTTFALTSEAAQRCVDVVADVVNDGARAVIDDCSDASLTQRLVESNGQLTVGGKCLDVDRNLTASGTSVIFWECNSQRNQQWTVNADGSIRSLSADKCLDVDRAQTAAGTGLLIWDCNGQINQKWKKTPIGARTAPPADVSTVASSRCVAGKAVVTVTSTNTGSVPIRIATTSTWGTRTADAVQPGNVVTAVFSTRSASIPAGEVSAAATSQENGTISTATSTARYPATTCR